MREFLIKLRDLQGDRKDIFCSQEEFKVLIDLKAINLHKNYCNGKLMRSSLNYKSTINVKTSFYRTIL